MGSRTKIIRNFKAIRLSRIFLFHLRIRVKRRTEVMRMRAIKIKDRGKEKDKRDSGKRREKISMNKMMTSIMEEVISQVQEEITVRMKKKSQMRGDLHTMKMET